MKTEDSSIVCKINDYFKMPISYIKDKHDLKKNISTDLELIETIDSSCNSIYSFCFNTDNDMSKKISEQIINYYSSFNLYRGINSDKLINSKIVFSYFVWYIYTICLNLIK